MSNKNVNELISFGNMSIETRISSKRIFSGIRPNRTSTIFKVIWIIEYERHNYITELKVGKKLIVMV